MALYTSSYLKDLYNSQTSYIRERTQFLTESAKDRKTFDIFLSHSFLDKDEVGGIFIELTKKGYEVYVDWIIDPQLDRNNVTKQSAELVRTRMKASRCLLLAMSTNAQMSKWIPWELGFMDGFTKRCAIFPVNKEGNTTMLRRTEYLLLYPFIKRATIASYIEDEYITESAYSYVPFKDWVQKGTPPSSNIKSIEVY